MIWPEQEPSATKTLAAPYTGIGTIDCTVVDPFGTPLRCTRTTGSFVREPIHRFHTDKPKGSNGVILVGSETPVCHNAQPVPPMVTEPWGWRDTRKPLYIMQHWDQRCRYIVRRLRLR